MKELYVGFLLLLLSFLYLSHLNAEYEKAERRDRIERLTAIWKASPVIAAKVAAHTHSWFRL